jgi:hypothetical protein
VLIFKIYGEKENIWEKTIANLVSFRKAKRKKAPAGAERKIGEYEKEMVSSKAKWYL